MKKPTPPKKDTAPQSLFPPPQPSKHLRFEDEDPTVKPLDPPKYSRGNSSGSKILCDTCAKCWRMDIAGQLFNAVSATETGKAQFSIDGVNQVLDFCEDYNEGMARDMDHIELYLKSNPSTGFSDLIDSVYMPLFNEWLKPWITEDEDDNEPKKK